MEFLLAIGTAMFAGLFLSRLTSRWNLPDVTSYLIAGLLVGPLCLGQLGVPGLGFASFDMVEATGLLSDVSLGFIAFAIGSEFRVSALRKTGRQATVIAILQALAATLLVDGALLVLHLFLGDKLPVSTCLILGAIATATAPAATLMVINQYKAKGPLTDILLPIVALDDAVGLIVFAISTGIARALISGSLSIVSLLVNPMIEITASLAMGAALGWVFSLVEKFFNSGSKRLSLAVAFVVICSAMSKLHFVLPGGVTIGVHDVRHHLLQFVRLLRGDHVQNRALDRSHLCTVLRAVRCGAGSESVLRFRRGGHWHCLHSDPLHR